MYEEVMEPEVGQAAKKLWVLPRLEMLEIKHTHAEEWEFVETPDGFWKRQLMLS
jgi:hypothetical protein